jgi:hypothetical protein
MVGKLPQELAVGRCTQAEERLSKLRDQKISDEQLWGPVRSGQAREHRVRLEGAVLDQP